MSFKIIAKKDGFDHILRGHALIAPITIHFVHLLLFSITLNGYTNYSYKYSSGRLSIIDFEEIFRKRDEEDCRIQT